MFNISTQELFLSLPGIFLAISIQGFFQANSAKRFGDDSAKKAGRLTFSPIPHIDIMGLILLTIFNFGWSKPVQINIHNLKNKQKQAALIYMSGPICNFAACMAFLLILKILYVSNLINLFPLSMSIGLQKILLITSKINLTLFLFSFLPIYPLAGYFSVYYIIPPMNRLKLYRFQKYSRLILITIIVFPISKLLISPIIENILISFGYILKISTII
jgi:Zn-dependent protease